MTCELCDANLLNVAETAATIKMMKILKRFTKWLIPGIGVKRWILILMAGIITLGLAIALGLLKLVGTADTTAIMEVLNKLTWWQVVVMLAAGMLLVAIGVVKLSRNLLAPYRKHQQGHIIDVVHAHSRQRRGLKVASIGGGTGLPSVLRGLKAYTSNITAIVTVADDGGSSGRLRRELGVLPPGDLRNNIAALADAESLMTRLFQYRFDRGDLRGHAFGNLFIAALAAVVEEHGQGSIPEALIEIERVLNIQGRVLPATLQDVNLVATVQPPASQRTLRIYGESKITETGGHILEIALEPADVKAYEPSVEAILNADVVVIGPGSLYTSILPNLLVGGIRDALRATNAYKIYVCNVAVQPGETAGYTVAEHVMALERYIGRGVFQVVLANNAYPPLPRDSKTIFVQPVPEHHEVLQRYEVFYTDLIDPNFPWRHAPNKLAQAILSLSDAERHGGVQSNPVFANI